MKNWHDFSLLSKRPAASGAAFDPLLSAGRPFEDELLLENRDPELEAEMDRALADQDLLAAVLSQAGEAAVAPEPQRRAEPSAPVSWTIPGFEGECRVSTNFGELPVKALRRRDMVKTISGAYKEVKKVDAFRLDADFMTRHPAASPVMIRARAMGGTFPTQNMLVSPGQKLWLAGIGGTSGAKTAEALEGTPGILRMRRTEIVYYRFHLGSEEKVSVEGAWFITAPE